MNEKRTPWKPPVHTGTMLLSGDEARWSGIITELDKEMVSIAISDPYMPLYQVQAWQDGIHGWAIGVARRLGKRLICLLHFACHWDNAEENQQIMKTKAEHEAQRMLVGLRPAKNEYQRTL